jgi:hypothetical protein
MHDLKRILNIIVNQFKGELDEKVWIYFGW